MSLPSADTADLWMRKNIAEVTDPETGAKSYEADEAYMRTGTPADVSKIERAVADLKAENKTLAEELRAAKIVLGVE